jgi:hypothetical protein
VKASNGIECQKHGHIAARDQLDERGCADEEKQVGMKIRKQFVSDMRLSEN